MDNIESRASKAIKRYLCIKDYEILDDDCNGFIVAKDEDEIVFITYGVVDGFDLEKSIINVSTAEFEEAALKFLEENEEYEGRLRLDTIEMQVVNNDRGFIRHSVDRKLV